MCEAERTLLGSVLESRPCTGLRLRTERSPVYFALRSLSAWRGVGGCGKVTVGFDQRQGGRPVSLCVVSAMIEV